MASSIIEKQWTTKAGLDAVVAVMSFYDGYKHHRCGYVQVPVDHPWYGEDYYADSGDIDIDVHGGLTFSGQPVGIDHGWWFGFDCAHLGDGVIEPHSEYDLALSGDGPAKSLEFCEAECESMAAQIVANGDCSNTGGA